LLTGEILALTLAAARMNQVPLTLHGHIERAPGNAASECFAARPLVAQFTAVSTPEGWFREFQKLERESLPLAIFANFSAMPREWERRGHLTA